MSVPRPELQVSAVSNKTDGPRSAHHDPDLMTLTQAATFLRVRPTELMAAVRNGEVPFYRQRGRLWFSRSELVERLRRGASPTRHEDA